MNKDLKKQLQTGHRPRPLIYVGRHNGKKCYVRKHDLTYWQLRSKYPPKPIFVDVPRGRHIFQKRHFRRPAPIAEWKVGYFLAACGIAIFLLITTIYTYLLLGALL